MVNRWFGARWFGIRIGLPLSNNPFHKGDPKYPRAGPSNEFASIGWMSGQDETPAFPYKNPEKGR